MRELNETTETKVMEEMESIPAHKLLGRELSNGWKVSEKVIRSPNATGGNFSVSYLAQKNGHEVFVKAIDLSPALQADDLLKELKSLTDEVNFEAEVLEICRKFKFKNVVNLIDHGTERINGDNIPVPYFVFEKAKGDTRTQIDFSVFDAYQYLTVLHNVSNGLLKLHQQGICHQDVKPSNVLVFENYIHKITDLGRSTCLQIKSPFDESLFPGDRSYASPEKLYGHQEVDWFYRNQAVDFYQLGSLIVFLFTQTTMNLLLHHFLPESFRWGNPNLNFDQAKPYLHKSFNKSLSYFKQIISEDYNEDLSKELEILVRHLCNPEPRLRGNPKYINKPSNLNLEFYVSRFDALRKKQRITAGR